MIVFLFSYMAITPMIYPPVVYLEPALLVSGRR